MWQKVDLKVGHLRYGCDMKMHMMKNIVYSLWVVVDGMVVVAIWLMRKYLMVLPSSGWCGPELLRVYLESCEMRTTNSWYDRNLSEVGILCQV